MLPSEELRQSIEETYNINLKQYAWREEFKKTSILYKTRQNT